jgi:hypothetical protein
VSGTVSGDFVRSIRRDDATTVSGNFVQGFPATVELAATSHETLHEVT